MVAKLTVDEAKSELAKVFAAYPSYEDHISRLADPKKTTAAWATILTRIEAVHVRSVITDIVSGAVDPVGRFEKWDYLPTGIIREADRRRESAYQVHRTEQLSNAANECDGAMATVANMHVGRIAITLGERVRSGSLSKADNDAMMDELCEWEFRGGAKPEWLTKFQTKGGER